MLKPKLNIRVSVQSTLTSVVMGLFIISAFLGGFVMFTDNQAVAATNNTLNFQARLEGAAGNIAPDGNYNVQFKLYNVSGAGTALWTESHIDENGTTAGDDFRVRVVNGYLSVSLGSRTAFPSTINWDQDMWLTMNIGGTAQTATPTYDGEMSPRLKLTGVPYAFRAGQLAVLTGTTTSTLGFATQTAARSILLPDEAGTLCVQSSSACGFATTTALSGYVQFAPGGAQADSSLNNSIFINKTGTSGNLLQLQKSGADMLVINNAGNATFGGTATFTGSVAVNATYLQRSDSTSAFNLQTSGGLNSLLFDGTNKRLRIYETGASPSRYAEMYYDAATGRAVFAASSGDVQVGNGSGDVIIGTTSTADTLQYVHSGTAAAAYTDADVFLQRNITGGANNLQGSVVKIEDISTTTGANTADLLVINQNNTGASGNLIVAQTGSTTARFSVTTAGNGFFAGNLTVAGLATCSSLQTSAAGLFSCGAGGGGVTTIGTLGNGVQNADGASISGSTLFLQRASTSFAGLVDTTTQSFSGEKTFNNRVTLGAGVTVAAGQSISLVGGITSTRPAAPTEGMLYYDQTTKQLLVYANAKWQSYASSTATVVVGTTAVGGVSGAVASRNADGADFVNTSDTSAQTVINNAIAALPATGGMVYLMEGTYIIDGSISLPNNTTLQGAGEGTVIKFKNAINADFFGIRNTDTTTGTRVVIKNLRIDGNAANQTAGLQGGVNLNQVGAGTGPTAREGATVENVSVRGVRTYGIYTLNSYNSTFTNNKVISASTGFWVQESGSNIFNDNLLQANTNTGVLLFGGNTSNNVVSGNILEGNADGIWIGGGGNNTITGNAIRNSSNRGLDMNQHSAQNTVSGNHFQNIGGTTANNAIVLHDAHRNTITGNEINDSSCTTNCFAINILNAGATGNYLANNRHSGSTANPSTIQDLGAGTIYANQLDGNGNLINRNQGGMSVGKTSATATLDLQGGIKTAILPVPAAPTVSVVGTAGTTVYRYRVTALDGNGETTGSTITDITNGNATLSATNHNRVTWAQIDGAVQYKLYRCSGTGCVPQNIATVAGNIYGYNDTAAGTPSGSPPSANTTGRINAAGQIQGSNFVATSNNVSARFDAGVFVNNIGFSVAPWMAGTGIQVGSSLSGSPDFTGTMIAVTPSHGYNNGGTFNETGRYVNISRNNSSSNAALTLSGDLVNLQSNCTISGTGTCTDTARIMNIAQNNATSSGTVINVVGAGTGNLAMLDTTNASANGVSIDVQSAATSQYGLRVTSNNGAITGLFVRADGNVGIGTASPASALHIGGAFTASGMAAPATSGVGAGRIYFDSTANKFRVSENNGAYVDLLSAGGTAYTTAALDTVANSGHGIGISGSTIFLQSASASHAGAVNIAAQTFAGAKTFSNTVTLSAGVSVAAGQSLSLAGGITSTRPAAPTEGMVYYDTTTKQFLAYANGKWQGDRSNSTKIVAASNASQAIKDAADYVATGAGDQTTINTALTAAAGGSVYLTEGAYSLTAAIAIPNNTTLFGSGAGSLITIPNAQNGTYNFITNSDTTAGTGIAVHNLQIDGNKANQTSGFSYGIYLNGMGGGSGSTARAGAKVTNLIVRNMYSTGSDGGSGVMLMNSSNNTISDVTAISNGYAGIHTDGSSSFNTISGGVMRANARGIFIAGTSNNTYSGILAEGNFGEGFMLNGGSNNTFTGNTAINNTNYGFHLFFGSNNVVTGNNIQTNGAAGILMQDSSRGTITGNKIHNNGNNAGNNGISMTGSSVGNTISSNSITDTSCTTTCYAISINSTSSSNHLIGNQHSGTTANPSVINDLGTGTIYANQLDGSGNLINRNQAGFGVGKTSAGTSLDLQGAFRSAQLPTPAAPTVTVVGTAGTTIYRYQITALDGLGETIGSTVTEITTGNAILDATNHNRVTWPQTGGAMQYRIYRCSGTGCVPANLVTVASTVYSYNDTAAGTPSGAAPTANTTGNVQIAGALQGTTATLSGTSSLTLGTSGSASGSIVVRNSTNANTVTIASGATSSSYQLNLPAAIGTAGQCITLATVSGAIGDLGFAACGSGGSTTLQGAYDASTSPATIATTSATKTIILKAGTGFDSTSLFQVQNAAGAAVVNVDTTNTALTVGNGANTVTISSTGYLASGTARNSKRIMLTAEYAGAVLDAGTALNNQGSMTSGVNVTNRMNFYKWTTTQATNQSYDVVLQVPIPRDFSAWGSATPITVSTYSSDLTNGTIGFELRDSGNVVVLNFVSVTPTAVGAWQARNPGTVTGTYTDGDYLTIRLRLQSPNGGDIRVGNITMDYLSKF